MTTSDAILLPADRVAIRRHQAEAQLGSLKAIYIANGFTAVAVAFGFAPQVPAGILAAWLALVLVVFHPGARRWMRRYESIPDGYRIGQWQFRMAFTGACSAATWVLPMLFVPLDGSPMHEGLLNSLGIGLTAVTFAVNTVNPPMCLTYALTLLLPLVLRDVLIGNTLLIVIVVLSVPYLGLLLTHQRAACRRLEHSIRHERQNDLLSDELALANRRLQDQVAELAGAKSVAERAQHEATAAKDQAEAATRAKSEFLANMSHELRTPLNAILGFSEIIQGQALGPLGSPKYGDYAGYIRSSGQHLLEIINDILDMSKIEAGMFELRDNDVEVGRTLKASLRLVEERAKSENVSLALDVPASLPLLRADEVRFKQIVINLITNAVKFTPAGGHVSVAARLADGDGGLEIRVQDSGIGMTEAEIATALQPFRQVDNSLERRYEGTGLGLPLVKALVEMHQGRLQMQSTKQVGTLVTVSFPATRLRAAYERAARARVEA